MIHDLKIEDVYAERIMLGQKNFEIRRDDRDYQVGDVLYMTTPSDAQGNSYTVVAEVTYKSTYMQRDGYCVLGIKLRPECKANITQIREG